MNHRTDGDVAKHWDENADQWTRDVRDGFDVYRDRFTFPAFLDFLPPINELDVVDFGCGEGTNTRAFARLGARMTGIDLSGRMIEHAQQMEDMDPLGVQYRVSSYSEHCGLPDASYDAVISTMALMGWAGHIRRHARGIPPPSSRRLPLFQCPASLLHHPRARLGEGR